MKKITAVIAFTLIAALSGAALATEMAAPKPVVVKDQVMVKATVEAIDHTNRTVTLKGPEGNMVTLYADEGVKRFDALKVGDIVTADYAESVTFELVKPGTPVAPDKIVQGAGKLSGEKPGGGVSETTITTVTIMAIDKAASAVTVKMSDGAIKSFRARHKENLDKIKVGDKVQVTQTASLMLSVEPAK